MNLGRSGQGTDHASPIPPPPHAQAFVDELVNIGELKWLVEWNDATDKKGLLTKVTSQSLSVSRATYDT